MAIELLTRSAAITAPAGCNATSLSAASSGIKPQYNLCSNERLCAEIAAKDALLRERDEQIERQEALRDECDHRLMNSLQMIASLVSIQSKASTTTVAAAQLAVVADRIAAIGRIHRHLHRFDGVQTIALKPFIEEYCCEFSAMLATDERPDRIVAVEAVQLQAPAATGIPLGFILNELVTNAAKYGQGRITVRLERRSEGGHALSVANDGPPLPECFDPAASKGLGMKILRSFVAKIGGELVIGRNGGNRGARFTVLFS